MNLLRYCGIKVDFCNYNQDLKDKVDALSKEITQLKRKVRVDSAITFGAEAAATSGNSNNNASNDETVSRNLQYLSDEYDDLSSLINSRMIKPSS